MDRSGRIVTGELGGQTVSSTQAHEAPLPWKAARRLGQVALVLLIFGILARNVAINWETIRAHAWRIDLGYLATSTVCIAGHFLLVTAIWRHMLRGLGFPLSFAVAFRIWFLASFVRYLPGRIWSVIGIVYLCEQEGIPRTESIASGVLNQVFSLVTGALLGLFAFRLRSWGALPGEVWVLMATIASLAVVVHPRGFSGILRLAGRVQGRPPIRYRGTIWTHTGYLLWYFVSWVVFGAGLFLLARSFADLSLEAFPRVVAIFAFANIAGFLSIFTPNGLGVREGLLSYFLTPYLPLGIATIVAISFRLWIMLVEVIYFAVAYRMR